MRRTPSRRWRPGAVAVSRPSASSSQPAASARSSPAASTHWRNGRPQPARSARAGRPRSGAAPSSATPAAAHRRARSRAAPRRCPFASTAASQRSGTADRAGGELVAAQSQPAMRAGPDADIVAVAPVHEVVTRLLPGSGMVADLVGRQAGTLQHLLGQLVEVGLQIRVERLQLALLDHRMEARARLDGQLIERQMPVWRCRGPGPARPANPPRSGQGGRRSGRTSAAGRPAPPAPRRPRPRRYRARGQERPDRRSFRAWMPKETRFTPAARNPRNRSASTEVGLASRVISMSGANGPTLGGTVDDRGHGCRLHQRRRAAAEEDRAQGAAWRQLRKMIQLGHQGPRPARMVDATADVAIEVAVWAFGLAERPVDVEGEAPVR